MGDFMISKLAIVYQLSIDIDFKTYIFISHTFDLLETQEEGKGGEIQLTDALQTLATKEAIYAYNFEGRRYDVGDKLGFLEATVDFALKRPELRDEFEAFIKEKAACIER